MLQEIRFKLGEYHIKMDASATSIDRLFVFAHRRVCVREVIHVWEPKDLDCRKPLHYIP